MTGAAVRTLRWAGSDGVGEGDALVFQSRGVWEKVAKHPCGEGTFEAEKSRGKKALRQESVSMHREQTAGAGDVARSQSTGDAY